MWRSCSSPTRWRQALADLHRALVHGGRLTFDTRDPRARGWERWNPADSRREVNLPDGRHVTATTEVDAVADGGVSFTIYYAFADGMHLLSSGDLRFRSEDELRSSLLAAGYAVAPIYPRLNLHPPAAPHCQFPLIPPPSPPRLT